MLARRPRPDLRNWWPPKYAQSGAESFRNPTLHSIRAFSRHATGNFCHARILATACPSSGAPSPDPTRGTNHEEFDFLSHRTDRWAVNFLPGVWSERRPDDSLAARFAVFFANVQAALRPPLRSLSPGRSRLPRLRSQRLAEPENIRVHLRSHRGNHESLHRKCSVSPTSPSRCRTRTESKLSSSRTR